MVPAVDHWVERVVGPAARYHFGAPIVELEVAASLLLPGDEPRVGRAPVRARARQRRRHLGLRAGRRARGAGQERLVGRHGRARFLRAVHGGACSIFTTVLGPSYDANHRDHFHLDLARHGRDGEGRICK